MVAGLVQKVETKLRRRVFAKRGEKFDQLNFPSRQTMSILRTLLNRIESCGYAARHFDGDANFLFVRAG